MTAADNSKGAGQDDDLPDVIEIVRAVGLDAMGEDTEPPSPPLPCPAGGRTSCGSWSAPAGASREACRSSAGLCRSCKLRQHPPRLCRRLEAFLRLGAAAGCRCVLARSASGRPLYHGLRVRVCSADKQPNSVSTIERRLSSLSRNFTQRRQPLDRKDRHIVTVMAGIRNRHAAPPRQKEAILPEDLIAMLETLDRGTLCGLRDRAMLLIGFAGGLRRSEIVGLDAARDQTEDGRGWVEVLDKGMLVTLRGKTGWREVEVGRGSSDATCPVVALQTWLKLARIEHGPLFRRVTGQGKAVGPERLNDQEVARLVKRTALAAGVRGDLPEGKREMKFSGHSLRAGLASSAEVDERYVQKQLGHASAEMTRKYHRRRDRFRVNLTRRVACRRSGKSPLPFPFESKNECFSFKGPT